ncbi:hypothetical protein EYC80_000999 [Monilinia laxa]|uniref:Uncharacterized protein n=1 Tax=Monilinia laxa TaxID=61186 RepID=A0A5N6K7T3_MONLA|nr:hypothetical protein EYC80_000999 [Monilinia laxa]
MSVAKFWYCAIAAERSILTKTTSKIEILKTGLRVVYSAGQMLIIIRTNSHINTDQILCLYKHQSIPLNCLSLKHQDLRSGRNPPKIMFALCS